jgi:phage-related protein
MVRGRPRPSREVVSSQTASGGTLRSRQWRFYRTAAGKQVVKEELAALEVEARARIVDTMRRVRRLEHFPYELEHIDGDLQAVRVFYNGCTYRVLFVTEGEHDAILLALNVMQKKSRKLPQKDKRLAERRLQNWRERRREVER